MQKEQTFGPAEVCAAAGVPRATFHSWVARRYFPLPPSAGAGRERRFSLTNAVRVAIVAELTRIGVSIGVAANAARLFQEPFRYGDQRAGLLLVPDASPAAETAIVGPNIMAMPFTSFAEIGFRVAMRPPAGAAAFTVVDVTAVAERTIQALEGGQEAEPTTPAWLNQYLEAPAESDDEPLAKSPKSGKAAAPKG